VVCGLWFVVCGLWFVVCGLWFVVCGLWFVVCGLWFVVCPAVLAGSFSPIPYWAYFISEIYIAYRVQDEDKDKR